MAKSEAFNTVFALLTFLMAYVVYPYATPFLPSEPWYPSTIDRVPMGIVESELQHWMNTILASADAETWTNPQTRVALIHRPKTLSCLGKELDKVACGQCQDALETWIRDFETIGGRLALDILNEKPDFCEMAPIRRERVPGQHYYSDSHGGATLVWLASIATASAGLSLVLTILVAKTGWLSPSRRKRPHGEACACSHCSSSH